MISSNDLFVAHYHHVDERIAVSRQDLGVEQEPLFGPFHALVVAPLGLVVLVVVLVAVHAIASAVASAVSLPVSDVASAVALPVSGAASAVGHLVSGAASVAPAVFVVLCSRLQRLKHFCRLWSALLVHV